MDLALSDYFYLVTCNVILPNYGSMTLNSERFISSDEGSIIIHLDQPSSCSNMRGMIINGGLIFSVMVT